MAKPPGGRRTWTVVDDAYRTVAPVEEWLEAHRHLWSPNTVRGYATVAGAVVDASWSSAARPDSGVRSGSRRCPAFLSWLRNGRTVEHLPVGPDAGADDGDVGGPAGGADLVLPLAGGGVMRCRSPGGCCAARRAAARPGDCLRTWMLGMPAAASSLVRVRRDRRRDRPPLLLPQQIQAILDGCAVCDDERGRVGGQSARPVAVRSSGGDAGCGWVRLLGMRISDFVMGRGGTPYVEIVPREDNPNGARVKMMRPRRVYVGADLERLFADYLTHLACRAAEFGIARRTAMVRCW